MSTESACPHGGSEATCSACQDDQSEPMQRWEYGLAVASDGYAEHWTRIKEMGRQGWELVSVTPETDKEYCSAYFKRRLNT